jgi:diguanylate cyclase (GGDEF)-like protein/PAS domain S-box-containing protein
MNKFLQDKQKENSFHEIITRLIVNKGFEEQSFYQTTFQKFIENAPVGIYILENGFYSYVNQHYVNLVGYSKEELLGQKINIDDIIHPDDCHKIKKYAINLKPGEQSDGYYQIRKICKNSQIIYTEMHVILTYSKKDITSFGTVVDITKQVLTEQKLEEGSEQFKSLFENSPEAIFAVDHSGNFISVNPACEEMVGYPSNELMEMNFKLLVSSDHFKKVYHHFGLALKGIANSLELTVTRRDGNDIYVKATFFPMKVNGEIVGCYGTGVDITQKILYEQQLEQLAFYDPLTNLPNRKLFEDRLVQVIDSSKHTLKPFAVLFLDLDRFKMINDSLGHQIGDDFLKLVSQRLTHNLRKKDTVSRLSGDEFTILLPETPYEECIKIVQRINQIISEPFNVSGHSVTVSVSVGIAFGEGNDTVTEIIRHADTAMYFTKKYKKNSYTIYSEDLDLKASYKLRIERDIKLAVENKELDLYYQPIIDMKSDKLVVMECLIRWEHPQLGFIPPGDFIPIAEESGQIIELGNWVLEKACRQAKKWQNKGFPPFKIAVNISTKQLQQYGFVDTVLTILAETKFEAKWLELEITESFLVYDVDMIRECLFKLKQAGISISIDDFGTGYTSLSYLRQFPLDKVKIDRSFIEDINRDFNGERITSAIISLAHSLNMTVVAEGIENEVQYNFLKGEGCNEGQGYYFSRPLPADSIDITSFNETGCP